MTVHGTAISAWAILVLLNIIWISSLTTLVLAILVLNDGLDTSIATGASIIVVV
jgi:hypothetical protein